MPSKEYANIKFPVGKKMKNLSKKWQKVVWQSYMLDYCMDCDRVFVSDPDNPESCPYCEEFSNYDRP